MAMLYVVIDNQSHQITPDSMVLQDDVGILQRHARCHSRKISYFLSLGNFVTMKLELHAVLTYLVCGCRMRWTSYKVSLREYQRLPICPDHRIRTQHYDMSTNRAHWWQTTRLTVIFILTTLANCSDSFGSYSIIFRFMSHWLWKNLP